MPRFQVHTDPATSGRLNILPRTVAGILSGSTLLLSSSAWAQIPPAVPLLYAEAVRASPVPFAPASSIDALPTPEQWLTHVQADLMPFWTQPSALGQPVGNFPSVRCNDGSPLKRDRPCPEMNGNPWLLQNRQYTVSLSRQIYTYGVAFQLTGDLRYLDYAKAGVDYLRQNAIDRAHGAAYAYQDLNTQQWGPAVEHRNSQEQAYALLGIGYYYYLTRDPEVLPDILMLKDFIFRSYTNPQLGLLQWQLQDGPDGKALEQRLTANLDQLNAYLVLLTPLLPEPHQSQWKRDMVLLSQQMLARFYHPEQGLFFLTANQPQAQDIQQTEVDFGHGIKAMVMIGLAGRLAGEQSLVDFADQATPRLLQRAYLSDSGSWANGVLQGGRLDRDKTWWVYAELDQAAALLSLTRPEFTGYLAPAQRYWLRYFIDRPTGETWSGISDTTHQPLNIWPKQWPWKNGYHTLEHALVSYIAASQLQQQSVQLHFAFVQQPETASIKPYFYEGQVQTIEPLEGRSPLTNSARTVHRVTFSSVY
jgi:mannose/cellobiose epimerase-like protein (N-acyl-D-glucosamine 2-epimerase family)